MRKSRGRGRFESLETRTLLSAAPNHLSSAAPRHVLAADYGESAWQRSADVLRATAADDSTLSPRELGPLAGELRIDDYVGYFDERDVFRFRLASDGRVDLDLGGLSADADVYLLDAGRRVLDRSVNAGRQAESIAAELTAGEYFVVVTRYGRFDSTFYTLNLAASFAPPAPVDGAGNSFAQARDLGGLAGGREFEDYVDADDPADVYRFRLAAASDVEVDLAGLRQDVDLYLYEILGDGLDNDGNGFVDDRYGWDFVSADNDPDDGNGHGTHVAGTIAAADDGQGATGVAPGALIMPVRVLDNDGYGSSQAVARGIRYAVDNGADIINLSLGGGNSYEIRTAVQYAQQHDVLVVAASGNESSATPSYPARHSNSLDNVISVGAFDGGGQLAAFSNRVGPSSAVQIDAPGVGVYSTLPVGRYGNLSGTSMATPHVAGVAALTLSANPDLTAAELRDLLVRGAVDSIRGSDSIGAVDAATTVALARLT